MRAAEFEAAAVAARQQFRLAGAAAAPDRAHGQQHVPRPQPEARRQLRFAGAAAAEPQRVVRQFRPRGAVDRAVHAAAGRQAGVGRVDDAVDLQRGDVADDQFDHGALPAAASGPNGRSSSSSAGSSASEAISAVSMASPVNRPK